MIIRPYYLTLQFLAGPKRWLLADNKYQITDNQPLAAWSLPPQRTVGNRPEAGAQKKRHLTPARGLA
jgi:hypothetical protein